MLGAIALLGVPLLANALTSSPRPRRLAARSSLGETPSDQITPVEDVSAARGFVKLLFLVALGYGIYRVVKR